MRPLPGRLAVGTWRSLVARTLGVREVVGSNPIVPTIPTEMKPSELASLPEHIKAIGFISGEEIAWRQEDCAEAIDWLRKSGYAVLGIELWLIQSDGSIRTGIPTESGPAIYVTSCDPASGENWGEYVERSAREAARAISAFRWDAHAAGPPRPVHFNLTWADREGFRTSSCHETHLADE